MRLHGECFPVHGCAEREGAPRRWWLLGSRAQREADEYRSCSEQIIDLTRSFTDFEAQVAATRSGKEALDEAVEKLDAYRKLLAVDAMVCARVLARVVPLRARTSTRAHLRTHPMWRAPDRREAAVQAQE